MPPIAMQTSSQSRGQRGDLGDDRQWGPIRPLTLGERETQGVMVGDRTQSGPSHSVGERRGCWGNMMGGGSILALLESGGGFWVVMVTVGGMHMVGGGVDSVPSR